MTNEDSDYHRQQMLDRERFILNSQREGYHVTVLDNGNVVAERSRERAAQQHRR